MGNAAEKAESVQCVWAMLAARTPAAYGHVHIKHHSHAAAAVLKPVHNDHDNHGVTTPSLLPNKSILQCT